MSFYYSLLALKNYETKYIKYGEKTKFHAMLNISCNMSLKLCV